jgi:hypothetical protein
MRTSLAWQALAPALCACTCIAAHAAEPTATAIEFYSAALNHYFITAYPDEAAMLDAGVVVPGWTRTGARFSAWAQAGDKASALAVWLLPSARRAADPIRTSTPPMRANARS